MIRFQDAQFLISAAKYEQLPADEGVEVAFAGRSNAGKSSVINVLTRQKNLARTSKTPGRTQLLNLFTLTDECRLMDLPGYGYAKVPGKISEAWSELIDHYLSSRHCLKGVVLVMDCRHPLKPFDSQMIEWSKTADLPIHVLLNKCDKLSHSEKTQLVREMKTYFHDFPKATWQLFSATHDAGLKELEAWLSKIFLGD